MRQHYKDNQNNLYGYKPEGFDVTPITLDEAKAIQAAKITAQQQYEAELAQWKSERQAQVEAIEVAHAVSTGETVIFQGDEVSQGRMTRPIAALSDDTTTVNWVAKDNSVWPLTKSELKAILFDAGQQQTAIWNEGRPVAPVAPVQEETV